MDISPALATQVNDAGELVDVSDDVLNIARDLRDIDPSLRLRYSERHGFWAVYQEERHPVDGHLVKKQLVTTCKGELNPQIVERVRKVANPGYDLVAEVEKLDAQRKRDHKHAQREQIGERAERLAHAIRKDTHRNQRRIFVPRGLPGT